MSETKRVKLTGYGRRQRMFRNGATTGTVISEISPERIRVLVDGMVYPQTFHPKFWEPIDAPAAINQLNADIAAMNRREKLYPDLLAFVRRVAECEGTTALWRQQADEARELVRRAEETR